MYVGFLNSTFKDFDFSEGKVVIVMEWIAFVITLLLAYHGSRHLFYYPEDFGGPMMQIILFSVNR